MIEIKGTYTNAIVYTDVVEDTALEQIKTLCDQSFVEDCKIRIMPDVHAGAGCVIGFTADLNQRVIPNIVGVDIGCGMLCVNLGKSPIDFVKLDEVIRKYVPNGFDVHPGRITRFPAIQELRCYRSLKDTRRFERSIGTLGGGNHFIEIDIDDDENHYLVIHTGSRNLGKQIADYYQNLAYDLMRGKDKLFEQQKMDIQTIRSVRISTAAPLGGIGDALFWFTLIPITAGMTANMAIDHNIMGPILYFIIAFGVEMALRYGLLYWSYNLGTKAVSMMTANAKEFSRAASILGVFVIGALIANYGGGTKLGISIPNGQTLDAATGEMVDVFINIQDYLNKILPCIIPLLFTLMCYFLIKKKGWTPSKCILLFLVIGIVGAIFGIWAGTYTPLVPVPWNVIG